MYDKLFKSPNHDQQTYIYNLCIKKVLVEKLEQCWFVQLDQDLIFLKHKELYKLRVRLIYQISKEIRQWPIN